MMRPHRRAALMAGFAAAFAMPGLAGAQEQTRPRLRQRLRRGGDGASNAAHTTVSVGPDPRQAFDVYGAASTRPILLFVHGGGWSRGSRTMVHALPDYATRHGLTLASADYRLVPAVTAREQAEDVAAAVARLKRDAPGRPIILMGHSAGAHLAALVGVDPTYLGAHGLSPRDALAGVILLDGAGYDATQPRAQGLGGGMLQSMYDQAFRDQRAELSPTLRVRAGGAYPPFLIFHIARREDSRNQSQALAAALRAAGGEAEVIAAPGDSHRDINVEFGTAGDAEGERGGEFIRRVSRA